MYSLYILAKMFYQILLSQAMITSKHPDVTLHVAAIDKELTADGKISPGMGDVGDRLYDGKKVVGAALSNPSPSKKRKL